jgi:hypothetical protein
LRRDWSQSLRITGAFSFPLNAINTYFLLDTTSCVFF